MEFRMETICHVGIIEKAESLFLGRRLYYKLQVFLTCSPNNI